MKDDRGKDREIPEGMFVPDDEELPAVGIDRHRPDDELTQHVPENRAEWAQYEFAEDGMPKPTVPTKLPLAPPLHPDTLCCIADTRKFCLRGKWGKVLLEFEPEDVERADDGVYRVEYKTAMDKWLDSDRAGLPDGVGLLSVLQSHAARHYEKRDGWLEVEPIRPQCKHFVRQATDFQDLPDRIFLARMCTARRDSGGEFMGLRDTQMFACDMRDPFDAKGIQRLDQFDQNKIVLGEERGVGEDGRFDVEAHLDKAIEEAHGTVGTSSNIFRKG